MTWPVSSRVNEVPEHSGSQVGGDLWQPASHILSNSVQQRFGSASKVGLIYVSCVQDIFEVGRRYKIMNPDRMRSDYGKLMYLLMDASDPAIQARAVAATRCMSGSVSCSYQARVLRPHVHAATSFSAPTAEGLKKIGLATAFTLQIMPFWMKLKQGRTCLSESDIKFDNSSPQRLCRSYWTSSA